MDLDTTDPTFVDELEASRPAEYAVVHYLRTQGMRVLLEPYRCRPDASRRVAFSDKGDIVAVDPVAGRSYRVEVKWRPGLSFVSVESFPYPTVFVDPIHRMGADFYFFVNAGLTGALLLKVADTCQSWTTTEDYSRGRKRILHECPKGLCEWRDLVPVRAAHTEGP